MVWTAGSDLCWKQVAVMIPDPALEYTTKRPPFSPQVRVGASAIDGGLLCDLRSCSPHCNASIQLRQRHNRNGECRIFATRTQYLGLTSDKTPSPWQRNSFAG